MPLRNRVTVTTITRLTEFENRKMVFEPATLNYVGSFLIVEENVITEMTHSPTSDKAMPYVEKTNTIKRHIFPSHEIQYAHEDAVSYEGADA